MTLIKYLLLIFIFLSSCKLLNYNNKSKNEQIRFEIDSTRSIISKNLEALNSIESEINSRKGQNPNSSVIQLEKAIALLKDSLIDMQQNIEALDEEKTNDFDNMYNELQSITKKLNHISQKTVELGIAVYTTDENTLSSDISFSTGSYELLDDGKIEIDKIIKKIEEQIINWNIRDNAKYSTKIKIISITVIGYSDLQGTSNITQRKKNNQELSKMRAQHVSDYMRYRLNSIRGKYNFDLKIETQGLGEELPPNISDKSKINNPKRRVCLISSNVSII